MHISSLCVTALCAMYYSPVDCVMPWEGVFARVLKRGIIHLGDEIKIASREREGIEDGVSSK